jgi:hypothetical protein
MAPRCLAPGSMTAAPRPVIWVHGTRQGKRWLSPEGEPGLGPIELPQVREGADGEREVVKTTETTYRISSQLASLLRGVIGSGG